MGTLINQLGNSTTILERSLGMPEGGPRCLPLSLDFAASLAYTLDYGNMQQRNFMSMVQSAWIDNSLNAAVLTITVPGSNQVIKFPAGKQGYIPLLVPNPIKLEIASTGGVLVDVILLNFPIAPIIWDFCPCMGAVDFTDVLALLQIIADNTRPPLG
jgi:hypothetical protein